MNDPISQMFATPALIYWGVVAVVIGAEHIAFYETLKPNEYYRRAMGIATVMFLGGFMVARGYWTTPGAVWLGLLFSFGLAGAVMVGLRRLLDNRKLANIRAMVARRQQEAGNGRDS